MSSRPPTRLRIKRLSSRLIAKEIGEKTAGGGLDQVERVIETLASAKERIGHVPRPRLRREIEKLADFVPRLFGGELRELLIVGAVHRQQEIEAVVVGACHLPCALARNIDAAMAGRLLGARVGRLARMPIAEPR
jgi:hypothetical protein